MLRTLALGAVVAVIALLLCSGIPVASHTTGATGVTFRSAVTPATVPPSAFSTGMAASVVLGAPNFTTLWTTPNASAFQPDPEFATMDSSGDVWVTDYPVSRVMEFLAPVTTGEAASVVVGQSTFTGTAPGTTATNLSLPAASTIDPHGNLWVVDDGNNRALEFRPPFHTGMAASVVIGQSNFVTNSAGTTATNLTGPGEVSFDGFGNMWLTDTGNNRVLEFVPPFVTGMAASLVIGQTTFTGAAGGLTATNLTEPFGTVATQDTLWVADYGNNRVLGYSAPFRTGEGAFYVLGQTSFVTSSSTGEAAFIGPLSVSADSSANLWISDSGDNRVVEVPPPFSNFENPLVAIGQTSLTGVTAGDTATTLSVPFGAFTAPSGNLWVTDAANSRVLEYIPATYSVTVTASGISPTTSWTAIVDGTSVSGTGSLHFLEVNGTHTLSVPPIPGLRPNPSVQGFVVNGAPATVSVQFQATGSNPFSAGMPASLVIGQPNFNSAYAYSVANNTNPAQDGYAAMFDASGNLWVADSHFNRVLEFQPPFTNDMAASLVLGQSSFSGDVPGNTATNLSFPDGLTFDAAGDLWVSDDSNNRVVEFVPPFATGMAESRVIGQTGFGVNLAGHGPGQLAGPAGITFYNGALWVTDYSNSRVVEFPTPLVTGELATLALGQADLAGHQRNLSATNLSSPAWIAFDSGGNAWVADEGNNRALEYRTPFATGESASVVLGEPNFTTSSATYANSMSEVNGIWVDGHDNVWAADSGDNRVLEFSGPAGTILTNATPTNVLGQGNLTTYGANTSRTGLSYPTAVITDPKGNIWVVDNGNGRVVAYIPAQFTLGFTAQGLPPSTPWGVVVNGTSLAGSGTHATVSEVNGTYNWTATIVPGWSAAPSTGTAIVNGAISNVTIAYTQVTYSVTFTESGLTPTTNWSVTAGGVTHSSMGVSIGFSEPNGSYSFTVAAVAGYTLTNGTGTVTVSAGPGSVTVAFTAIPSNKGSSSGLPLTDLLLILVVVAVIVAALLAVVLMRRRRGGPTSTGPGPAPTAPVGPPPGASGPPPP